MKHLIGRAAIYMGKDKLRKAAPGCCGARLDTIGKIKSELGHQYRLLAAGKVHERTARTMMGLLQVLLKATELENEVHRLVLEYPEQSTRTKGKSK